MARYIVSQNENMIVNENTLDFVWINHATIYIKAFNKNDFPTTDINIDCGVLAKYPTPEIAEIAFNDFRNWLTRGYISEEYTCENEFSFPIWDKTEKRLKSRIPVA